jgi:phosphocarrier protein HPr
MRGSPYPSPPAPNRPPAGPGDGASEKRDAMTGGSISHTVRIINPEGLHMRPATAFAERARAVQSTVSVCHDGKTVNGKSPLDMMLLVAGEGSDVTVEVHGPDAPAALRGLVELLVELGVVAESELLLTPKG